MPSVYMPRPRSSGGSGSTNINPEDWQELQFSPDWETCFDGNRLKQLFLSKGGTEQEFSEQFPLSQEQNGIRWYCTKLSGTKGISGWIEYPVTVGKYAGAVVSSRRAKAVPDANGNLQVIPIPREFKVTKDQKSINWDEFWKSWNESVGGLYGNTGKGNISDSYFIWIILGIASLFLIWLAKR